MFTVAERLRRRPKRDRKRSGRGVSKRVEDRHLDFLGLVGAIRRNKDYVASRLAERQAPYLLAGETPPDHALSLELLAREVEAAFERLHRADRANAGAVMSHLAALRRRRDFMRREMYPTVRDLRQHIEAVLGREAGQMIHCLRGRTRRKMLPLELQAKMLEGRLESLNGRRLFSARGETVDPAIWLRPIAGLLERLAELDDAIVLRDQEHSRPMAELKDAIEAFDATYGKALRAAEAAFDKADADPRILRELRSKAQHRRLARWAGYRREDRAAKKELAPRPPARRTAPEAQAGSRVAALAGWLRRRSPTRR